MRRERYFAWLLLALVVLLAPRSAQAEVRFFRAEVNGDGEVDVSDAVRILLFLFRGGPPLPCPEAADVNDDGSIDVTDALYLLRYLFRHGPPPPAPFPVPGREPTEDLTLCPEDTTTDIPAEEHFAEIPFLEQTVAAFRGEIVSESATRKEFRGGVSNTVARLRLRNAGAVREMRDTLIANALEAGAFVGFVRHRGVVLLVTSFESGGERRLHFQGDRAGGPYNAPPGWVFDAPPSGDDRFFSFTVLPDIDNLGGALRAAMPPVVGSLEEVPVLRFDETPDGDVLVFLSDRLVEAPTGGAVALLRGGGAGWFRDFIDGVRETVEEVVEEIIEIATETLTLLNELRGLIELFSAHQRDNLFDLFGRTRSQLQCAADVLAALEDGYSAAQNLVLQSGRSLLVDPQALLEDFCDFSLAGDLGSTPDCEEQKRALGQVVLRFLTAWAAAAEEVETLATRFWGAVDQVDVAGTVRGYLGRVDRSARVTVTFVPGASPLLRFESGGVEWEASIATFREFLPDLPAGLGFIEGFLDEIESAVSTFVPAGSSGFLDVHFSTTEGLEGSFLLRQGSTVVWSMRIFGTPLGRGGFHVAYRPPDAPDDPCVGADLVYEFNPLRLISSPFSIEPTIRTRYRDFCLTATGRIPPAATLGVQAYVSLEPSAYNVVGGKAQAGLRLYLQLPLAPLERCFDQLAEDLERIIFEGDGGNDLPSAFDQTGLVELIGQAIDEALATVEEVSGSVADGELTVVLETPEALARFLEAVVSAIQSEELRSLVDPLNCIKDEVWNNLTLGVQGFLTGGGGVGAGADAAEASVNVAAAGSIGLEMPLWLWLDFLKFYTAPGREAALLSLELAEETLLDLRGDTDASGIPDWRETRPAEFLCSLAQNPARFAGTQESFLRLAARSLQHLVREHASDRIGEANALLDDFAERASLCFAVGTEIDAEAQFVLGLDPSASINAELSLNGEALFHALRASGLLSWVAEVSDGTLLDELDRLLDRPGVDPTLTLTTPFQVDIVLGGELAEIEFGFGGYLRLDPFEGSVVLTRTDESTGEDLDVVLRPPLVSRLAGVRDAPLLVPTRSAVTFSAETFLYDPLATSVPQRFQPASFPAETWKFFDSDGTTATFSSSASGELVRTFAQPTTTTMVFEAQVGNATATDATLVVAYDVQLDPPRVVNLESGDVDLVLTASLDVFENVSAMRLTRPGADAGAVQRIEPTDLQVISRREIHAKLNVHGAATGLWTVEVTLADGTVRVYPALLEIFSATLDPDRGVASEPSDLHAALALNADSHVTLQGASAVRLTMVGEAAIVGTNLLLSTDGRQLEFDFNVFDRAPGAWSLEVDVAAAGGGTETIVLPEIFTLEGAAGLANTPWPMLGRNPQHTGLGSAPGPCDVAPPPSGGFGCFRNVAWTSAAIDAPATSAVIGDARVYVGSATGRLVAIDRANGSVVWTFDPGEAIRTAPALAEDGTIYVATGRFGVTAALWAITETATETGLEPVVKPGFPWKKGIVPAGVIGEPSGSPAIGPGGVVYFGTTGGHLVGIDQVGNERVLHLVGNRPLGSPAIGRDGTIYVTMDDTLFAVSPQGVVTTRWSVQFSDVIETEVAIGTHYDKSGNVTGETIYCGGGCRLHAVTDSGSSGTVKWSFLLPSATAGCSGLGLARHLAVRCVRSSGPIIGPPPGGPGLGGVGAGGFGGATVPPGCTVYTAIGDGAGSWFIHAVTASGAEAWSLEVQSSDLPLGLSVGGSAIYATGADGNFYAVSDPILVPTGPAVEWTLLFTSAAAVRPALIGPPVIDAGRRAYVSDATGAIHAVGQ